MSVYDEVSSSVKTSEKNKNQKFIKNQKTMNMLTMILCLIMIIADTIYVIKESFVGILIYTEVILIIGIVAEVLMTILLALLRFNTENKTIKIMTAVAFSISIFGYIAMFKYADSYSIILFIFRIPLSAIFIYIAIKSMLVSFKSFIVRWVVGGAIGFVVLLTAIILLFSPNERRIVYKDNEVKEVLSGSSNVKVKDGTTSIGDYALKNAGKELTLPASINNINDKAFKNSEVTTLNISSSSIRIISALQNSNVNTINVTNNSVIEIKDIDKAAKTNNFNFVVSRDLVDAYRETYRKYDFLFVPKVDDNEIFIAYNGTILPVLILTKDQLPKIVLNPFSSSQTIKTENNNKYLLTGWYVNNDNISYPYSITESTELDAKWEIVYTVNYNYDGGTPLDGSDAISKEEFYESLPNKTLPILEKEGYTFTGWYLLDSNGAMTDTQIEEINTSKLSNMNLKARFVRNYQLSYHLNGGSMDEDENTIFNEDGAIIVPPTPTKLGYTFDGWYDNESFTGSKIALVSTIHKNDIELYAKWLLDAPTLNISNDVSKTYDNQFVDLTVNPVHVLGSSIEYTYTWYKVDSQEALGHTATYNNIRFVNQSGAYYCVVKATDINTGETVIVNSDPINVTINKADYSIPTIQTMYEVEYDGTEKTPNIGTIPAGLDGSTVNVIYSNSTIKNVGDDTYVTVSFETDSLNYNTPASIKIYVKVIKKTLTITWPLDLEFVYNGNAQAPTPLITGIIEGEECDFTYSSYSNNINVGTYTYTVMGLNNDNYKLPENVSVEYQIIQAKQKLDGISVEDLTVTYDGIIHYPTIVGDLPAGVIPVYSIKPINVGTHEVTIEFSYEAANYVIEDSLTGIVTISPKIVTISTNSILTYDKTSQAPVLLVNGLIDGDICTASIEASVDAGTYKKEVSLSNNNYALADNLFEYTINKAKYDYSLTFDDGTVTYDGYSHGLYVKGGLIIGSDGVQVEIIYSDITNNINVGTYEIEATFKGSSNYEEIESMTATLTIVPKTVTLTIVDSDLVFNGLSQKPTVKVNNIVDGDTCEVEIEAFINAGTHSINPVLKNKNYTLSGEDTYKFNIRKADYDISSIEISGLEVEYNGNLHYIEISNLPMGKDNYSLTAEYYIDGVSHEGKKDAGSYNVVIKFSTESTNYNSVSDINKTFIIAKKTLKVEWDSLEFKYNGSAQAPVATVTGYVNDDTATFEYTDTSNNINIGNYSVSIINLSNDNYQLPANAIANYTILKGNMALDGVSVTGVSVVYDGEAHYPTINGDLPKDVTPKYSVTPVNAGVYEVEVSFEYDSDDYAIYEVFNATVTISKLVITATTDGTLTYNGKEQAPTIVLNGVISGENVTASVEGHINAGSYTEDIILSSDNYRLSSNTLSYTINKAKYDYSLAFDDETITYDGNLHGLAVAGTLPKGKDDILVTVSYTSEGITNVGSETITATFAGSSNYEEISPMTATITITPKYITLTYKDNDLVYNGLSQMPIITVNGVISGDECEATITAKTDAGTYSTTDGSIVVELTNNNYQLPANYSYSYTISKADYDLSNTTYSNLETEYSGSAQGITISNLPTGKDNYKLNAEYYINDVKNATVSAVGEYQVIVKFTSKSNNYNSVDDVELTFVITPKTLVVTFSDELVYNGQEQAPTIKNVSGLIGSDVANISITAKTNAGTYSTTNGDIDVSVDNSNYWLGKDFEYEYTISPKTVSIVWGSTEFTYIPYVEQKPTATIDNAALTLMVTTDKEAINAGSYTATATITDSNYDVESEKTITFTIAQAEMDLSNITVNTLTATYDGNIHYPAPEGDLPVYDGYNVEYTVEGDTVSVGTHNVKVIFSVQTGNYKPVEVAATVIINKLNVVLEYDSLEFTYTGEVLKPSIVSSNIVDGDDVTILVTNTSKSANTYTINLSMSGTDSGNYNLSGSNTTYVINKANYVIGTLEYSNTVVTYNGQDQKPILESTLPTGADNIKLGYNIGSLKDATTGTDVEITFTTTSPNYNVPAPQKITMVINPKTITVSGTGLTAVYTGNPVAPTITLEGVIDGDDVSYNVINKNSAVGVYTLTAEDLELTNTDSLNYVLADFELSYEITKADYDTTGIIFNDSTVTYDGEEHSITISGSFDNTGVDGSTPDLSNITYTGSGINAGEYIITATIPAGSDNYNDVVLTATLSIEQATVDVTLYIDGSKITSTSTSVKYTGNKHVVTASADTDDLYNGDTVNLGVVITSGDSIVDSIKKAGTYTISAYVSDQNSNYIANYAVYTITIDKTYIYWLPLGHDYYSIKDQLVDDFTLDNGVIIDKDDVLNGKNEDFYYIYSVTSTGEVLDSYPTVAGEYTVTLHYDSDSVTCAANNTSDFTLVYESSETVVDFSSGWTLTGTDSSTAFSGSIHKDNSMVAISNSKYVNLTKINLTYEVADKGSTRINMYTSTDGITWSLVETIIPTTNSTNTNSVSISAEEAVYIKIEVVCSKNASNPKTATIKSCTIYCDVPKVS